LRELFCNKRTIQRLLQIRTLNAIRYAAWALAVARAHVRARSARRLTDDVR